MSDAAFARRCGIKYTTLRGYLEGKVPGLDNAGKIADAFGVSVDWLRGLDEERTQYQSQGSVPSISTGMVAIPRYAVQASAGGGAIVLAQDVDDYFTVGRNWLERYLPRGTRTGIIEARGDSMEPTIRDGDILLLNFDIGNQDIANGGVFVITIDGNLFVKRLQIMLDGSIMIRSDNERYEPERVDREYADEKMQVHARVVWAGGPLR